MWREGNMKHNPFWAAISKVLAVMTVTLVVALILAPGAWAAGTYKILHKFSRTEGGEPMGALIFDTSGNLYGTAFGGGCCSSGDPGTIFKLAPNANGSWTQSVLYSFTTEGLDGLFVVSAVIFDQAGNLYGTTVEGGNRSICGGQGCGVVYKLTPNSDGSWTESVLHSFNGSDGETLVGGLVFDTNGNLYGTAASGGAYGHGVVFKLAPNSDGSWTESAIHDFMGGKDGGYPDRGNLIFDAAGNLYGVTAGWNGGDSNGTVFELTPNSDGTWTESVLHSFSWGKDGAVAEGTLTFDQAGGLYGATLAGGAYGHGTIFRLTRGSDGTWKKAVLHQFKGGKDGSSPYAGVVFDTAGNLYGTTDDGGVGSCRPNGTGCGTVFKLIPNSKGGWTGQVLHRFEANPASNPTGGVLFDAAGNLYATTSNTGFNNHGVVFEITP
jgi:uncharacterized repeat protein (TIGR03803 family)